MACVHVDIAEPSTDQAEESISSAFLRQLHPLEPLESTEPDRPNYRRPVRTGPPGPDTAGPPDRTSGLGEFGSAQLSLTLRHSSHLGVI